MANLSAGQRVAIVALVVLLQVFATDVFCDTLSQANFPENIDSVIRVIDSTTYGIGNLIIDRTTDEIRCPGWVNMDNGVVEYLAVAPSGKTHESVLVVDVRPMHLQLALLLLGLDFGQNLRFQGDSLAPEGDSVYLSVRWRNDAGQTITHDGSDLILNMVTDSVMGSTPWVFTGSLISGGGLMADAEGSLVATYSDPVAILNNPLPERMDDIYFAANHKILPPRKTKIELIINKR